MKILENIFLLLSFLVPLFFIIIALVHYKKLKKNKKYKIKMLIFIMGSFLVNVSFYGVIKLNNLEQEKTDYKESLPTENQEQNSRENPTDNNQSQEKQDEVITETTKNLTSKGYEIKNVNGVTYIDGYLIVNKTYPLPADYIPINTKKSVTQETGICQECISESAYNAYIKMRTDAINEGLSIWIASGYRSYNYQKALYNNYVQNHGQVAADTFSARAGHSEHQSGLAFDLNSVTDAFANTKEGIWVDTNCYKYGFIIRYPKGKEDKTGYKYESWHLRYVGTELASKLYNNGEWLTMEEYFGITSTYK